MSDLIRRKALLQLLYEKWLNNTPNRTCFFLDGEIQRTPEAKTIEKIMKEIEGMPTVDAVEVVHGEWIKHKINPEVMRLFHQDGIAKAMGENSIFWTCSECKSWGTPAHKYCPNCGVKMDGGDGENNGKEN